MKPLRDPLYQCLPAGTPGPGKDDALGIAPGTR